MALTEYLLYYIALDYLSAYEVGSKNISLSGLNYSYFENRNYILTPKVNWDIL